MSDPYRTPARAPRRRYCTVLLPINDMGLCNVGEFAQQLPADERIVSVYPVWVRTSGNGADPMRLEALIEVFDPNVCRCPSQLTPVHSGDELCPYPGLR